MKRRNIIVNTEKFLRTLRKVNLNNTIEEIVVVFEKKGCFVEAIDISNSIIYSASEIIFKNKIEKITLGLSNIDFLIKFLKTVKEKTVLLSIEKNKLIISRKDKKRQMIFLLSDSSLIPTMIKKENKKEDVKKVLLKLMDISLDLKKDIIEDIKKLISFSKSTICCVEYKNSKINIIIGEKTRHQFKVVIDKNITKLKNNVDSFTLFFNAEYFLRILNVIDELDEITLKFGKDNPIIIEENQFFWALTPNIDNDESEENE